MKLSDGALRFCSQAFSWMVDLLIVSLSFIIFTVLDLVDRILCVVFWALDSILDPGSAPCYCKQRRNGVLPGIRGPTLNTAHSVLPDEDGGESTCGSSFAAHISRSVEHPPESTEESSFATFDHSGNEGKHALNNMSNNCAAAIHNLHMGKKDQSSSSQWKTHDSLSPNGITDGNNLMSSFQGSDHFSSHMMSRWSDCSCTTCTSWQANDKESLYVHIEGEGHENVVFIHGFLSSSLLWSEKVIPHLSNTTRATYRFFAVDLLGFGKSPKPRSCHYTMVDHIKKIEECVLHQYKIESFHLVAHSMGCLVALALAATHVNSIKTITLVAPPLFWAPANEAGASYVLRQVAPRRIWPLSAFGASVMSWYEHVGRGVCFVLCKQHITWEYVIGFLTLNRISRAAVRDFMQHTHHSAWHIFHNVICGEAHTMDGYLDKLKRAHRIIHVLHGKEDQVVPIHCSYQFQKRYPTLKLQVVNGANHFTIIYGHEILFSRMLERIWRTEALINKSSRKM